MDPTFVMSASLYENLVSFYALSLLRKFKSNKKARYFLREQLAHTADKNKQKFAKLVIEELEAMALGR